ncbi:MAG: Flp family type IVb pilin [Nocardioidaceae bacterium]|nr:Flp family type IVb pilin [Nocardioidaceae bacterium]
MLDRIRHLVTRRLASMGQRGASAVEYGLLVTAIAGTIVAVVFAFGGVINSVLSDTCTDVATHASTAGC